MKQCQCGDLAKFHCEFCRLLFQRENYFCEKHYKESKHCKYHHPKDVKTLKVGHKLQLFAVICRKATIKSNHYVAFLKTGSEDKSAWVYYEGKINISAKFE
jgi:uncharacterized UBP type Zn finger protein